ncbi:4Fe-4S_ferredoxin iron-sulfur binding domain protein [Hexamita inflata]|uniref:4Fe-4S ferredoxin iron-sulfur binding domain protein n=1 Tax=Hexamita inflata TaxID=28002 RepID=A0AA86NAV5_9EUKA|nr:4Fe-4S ferredoxin iron-sulfur binding domain protein [Hexamita inflata]
MKVGVLIGSITGNTENFAHVIMDELKKQDPTLTFEEYMINLEMNKKNSQADYKYPNCDAYLIGAYADFWTLPIFVRQYLESMPSENVKNKHILTFSTCGGNTGHMEYTFEKILLSFGAKIVANIQSKYPGSYMYLPTYSKKIKKQYVTDIPIKCAKFINAIKTGANDLVPKSQGLTYGLMNKLQLREVPIKFQIENNCVGCGTCVENCPSAIISLKDGKAVFTEQDKCVGCYACFQKCPVHAVVDQKKKLANKKQYRFDQSLLVDKSKSNWKLKAFLVVAVAGVVVMIAK